MNKNVFYRKIPKVDILLEAFSWRRNGSGS